MALTKAQLKAIEHAGFKASLAKEIQSQLDQLLDAFEPRYHVEVLDDSSGGSSDMLVALDIEVETPMFSGDVGHGILVLQDEQPVQFNGSFGDLLDKLKAQRKAVKRALEKMGISHGPLQPAQDAYRPIDRNGVRYRHYFMGYTVNIAVEA